MSEHVLTNARIVLDDDVIKGSLRIEDGVITDIREGNCALPAAEDLEGDYLIPGLVELHTDALEGYMSPRHADWPSTAAIIAHDSQLIANGITTVFDAVAVGDINESSVRVRKVKDIIEGITAASDSCLLRSDHKLHLRCEVTFPNLLELFDAYIDNPLVGLASIMDHTPGQRQFVSEDVYRKYYMGKHALTDEEMDEFVVRQRKNQVAYGEYHRRHVVDACNDRSISLASHDDATAEHVDEASRDGVVIAEFPTTIDAANASRDQGLSVLMGAPNLVRGSSHSGNVSARNLAGLGLLDILSSDYIPASLLYAAFVLLDAVKGFNLPSAIRTVTKTPAERAGLKDRGEIKNGKRADLVRVRQTLHHPLIRSVWRGGHRVC